MWKNCTFSNRGKSLRYENYVSNKIEIQLYAVALPSEVNVYFNKTKLFALNSFLGMSIRTVLVTRPNIYNLQVPTVCKNKKIEFVCSRTELILSCYNYHFLMIKSSLIDKIMVQRIRVLFRKILKLCAYEFISHTWMLIHTNIQLGY